MNEVTLLALTKFTGGDREAVAPGTYTIDELVHISGGMTVGEDYPQNITAAVPWQKLAAVLFSKLNGVTVESVVREALAAEVDDEEITKAAKAAISKLADSTERMCKGKVRLAVTVEAVSLSARRAA